MARRRISINDIEIIIESKDDDDLLAQIHALGHAIKELPKWAIKRAEINEN